MFLDVSPISDSEYKIIARNRFTLDINQLFIIKTKIISILGILFEKESILLHQKSEIVLITTIKQL